jgi:hypothetical protein
MLSPTSWSYFRLTGHEVSPTTTIDEICQRVEDATWKKLKPWYPFPELVPGRWDVFAYLPFLKTKWLIGKVKDALQGLNK